VNDTDTTKGLIVAAVLLTTVTAFIRNAHHGRVEFRTFLASGILGSFLFGIGMVSEKLARNFAVLVILVALLQNGPDAFAFTADKTNLAKPGKGTKGTVRPQ